MHLKEVEFFVGYQIWPGIKYSQLNSPVKAVFIFHVSDLWPPPSFSPCTIYALPFHFFGSSFENI